jgi:hypothetical protein
MPCIIIDHHNRILHLFLMTDNQQLIMTYSLGESFVKIINSSHVWCTCMTIHAMPKQDVIASMQLLARSSEEEC